PVAEQSGCLRPALLADARIRWYEGGVEGALGENGAEMVGKSQRHEEGVGNRTGAKHGGKHDVPHEAGETGEQREAANIEDTSNHRLCLIRKLLRVRPRLSTGAGDRGSSQRS